MAEADAAPSAPAAPTLPEGMDAEVFNCLPPDMQAEIMASHRRETDMTAAATAAGLDPEALAALPEDMRREVLAQEQERQERARREASSAPAPVEEMDSASFLASLAPELRAEVLLSSDDAFLQTLPPQIQAEAQLLAERAARQQQERRQRQQEAADLAAGQQAAARHNGHGHGHGQGQGQGQGSESGTNIHAGMLKLERRYAATLLAARYTPHAEVVERGGGDRCVEVLQVGVAVGVVVAVVVVGCVLSGAECNQ
jgi:hypothetical protein